MIESEVIGDTVNKNIYSEIQKRNYKIELAHRIRFKTSVRKTNSKVFIRHLNKFKIRMFRHGRCWTMAAKSRSMSIQRSEVHWIAILRQNEPSLVLGSD